MRGFEQGTSKARCIIIQFHRPAELKLRRIYKGIFPCMSVGHTGFFILPERKNKERVQRKKGRWHIYVSQ